MHTHGRALRISATLPSWAETIGLPLGEMTSTARDVHPGALAVTGVALAAGLIGLPVSGKRAAKPATFPV